jgi:hypothetical protein
VGRPGSSGETRSAAVAVLLQAQLADVKNRLFDAEEREKKYRQHVRGEGAGQRL